MSAAYNTKEIKIINSEHEHVSDRHSTRKYMIIGFSRPLFISASV